MSRIVTFPYYLHDDYMRSEFLEYLREEVMLEEQSVEVTEEDVERMGRPFYEISFSCAADLDTGRVVLLACEGQELENPVVLNKGIE